MSKRTELVYKNAKNGYVVFLGFKNVMTLKEIDKEIGNDVRVHSYAAGRCYFRPNGTDFIRIFSRKEGIAKEYFSGGLYSQEDWNFFIDFLREAGERYADIKTDLESSKVKTVII